MFINIEHEDRSFGLEEGLAYACETLFEARKIANLEPSS
jgi:hypothetical protein